MITMISCYMEHSKAKIDGSRSDHEEADSRVFVNVSHAI